MPSVSVQVIGLKELERKLKALGPMIAKKALKSALVAGAKVIRTEIISNEPVLTGRLRRATYIKKMNKPNPFTERVIIGVRHGKAMQKVSQKKFGKTGLDAFYWTFQEFDHLVRGKKGRSKYARMAAAVDGTKVIPGKHFITRAFQATKERALAIFKEVLAGNIKKIVQGGVR